MKCISRVILSAILIVSVFAASYAANDVVQKVYAWSVTNPLGERYPAAVDTLQYNYQRQSVPSLVSNAYALTGNLGAEGQNMLFFQRSDMSAFFFADALEAWLPSIRTQRFYNSRIPMTLMSYNTGGGKENIQDRLKGVFSGNINKNAEVGMHLDYIYSKGCYDYQADKDFSWGAFGSYFGDRYEMQAFYNHMNFLNKENGGITDDRYITNPAAILGNTDKIEPKAIPTFFSAAHSKIEGQELWLNQRYKVGFYHHERDSLTDSIVSSTYIPVTSFIWTLNFKDMKHKFINTNASQDTAYFRNNYLSVAGTDDNTSYWSLKNTLGVQLLEGFNRYAKFGLAAYATLEYRKYTQNPDSGLRIANRSHLLTPAPAFRVPEKGSETLLWVGGQLTKKQGSLLTYTVLGQIGIVGSVAADIDISGEVSSRFRIPLLKDSLKITGYGYFKNLEAPYLMNHYISNHFMWENDFGKTKRIRIGGRLLYPRTGTHLDIGTETLKDYLYFNSDWNAAKYTGGIQVFSASLKQDLHYRALHWENSITYQTTSNSHVIPLPSLTVYSNLYLNFSIARVLHVQLGMDCDYYTAYYAPSYNPATMTFCSQEHTKVGNYPFMNAYATFKLQKARFYLMMSHVNQGMTGKNYFSMPGYPLNPQRFQLGVSVDFTN